MLRSAPKRKARPGLDEYGRTALHYACVDGNVELCSKLLRDGADPNIQDDNGFSPLHFAAQSNSAGVTKLLLSQSARVDLVDSFGNTALWRATMCCRGNGEVIGLLRSAGADPTIKNHHGYSSVDVARNIGNFDVAQFFDDLA